MSFSAKWIPITKLQKKIKKSFQFIIYVHIFQSMINMINSISNCQMFSLDELIYHIKLFYIFLHIVKFSSHNRNWDGHIWYFLIHYIILIMLFGISQRFIFFVYKLSSKNETLKLWNLNSSSIICVNLLNLSSYVLPTFGLKSTCYLIFFLMFSICQKQIF